MIGLLPQGYDTVLTGSGANISQGQRQLCIFLIPYGQLFFYGKCPLRLKGEKSIILFGNYERYFIGEDEKQYGHILLIPTPVILLKKSWCRSQSLHTKKNCAMPCLLNLRNGAGKEKEYWRINDCFDMLLVTEENENGFSLNSEFIDIQVHVILLFHGTK